MIRGINAGFGGQIAHELPELARRGVKAIRQGLMPPPSGDLRPGQVGARDPVHSARLAIELVNQPFWVQWVANLDTLQDAPIGSDVTLLNEPNLHGWHPQVYADYLNAALDRAAGANITIWGPSVSGISRADLMYVAFVLKRAPRLQHLDFHWYPAEQTQDPMKPAKGWKSIDEQFQAIAKLADGRPWTISEVGIHQAPLSKGPNKGRRLTDIEQRDRIRWQLETLERFGSHAAFVYQLSDDGRFPDHPEGCRGIRRADGTWKLAADPQDGVFV